MASKLQWNTLDEASLRQALETAAWQGERLPEENFLVEAGAGAGKSHTICQRLLSLLEWEKPEHIVAITFTEKATEELKDKLDKAARAYDQSHSGSDRASQVQEIHISTIHGFCRKLLSLFPLSSGSGFGFEVLPEEVRQELLSAVTQEAMASDPGGHIRSLRNFYGWGEETLLHQTLAAMGNEAVEPGLLDGTKLKEKLQTYAQSVLASQHHVAASLAPHAAALRRYCGKTTLRFLTVSLQPRQDSRDLERFRMRLAKSYPGTTLRLERFLGTVEPQRVEEIRDFLLCQEMEKPSEDTLSRFLDRYPEAAALNDLDQWQRFAQEKLDKHPGKTALMAVQDAVAGLGKLKPIPGVRKGAKALNQELFKEIAYEYALRAALPIRKAFEAECRRQALCTNDDLLRLACRLVREDEEARQVFHRRYRHFYVDEFQDTDPIQAELLFRITHADSSASPVNWGDWKTCTPAPGSLFLVGDPKQAIYRFRGADLNIYKAVRERFAAGLGTVVQLKWNFRSNPAVCDFVHEMFQSGSGTGLMKSSSKYQAPYLQMEPHQKPTANAAQLVQFYSITAEKMTGLSREEARKQDAELLARSIRQAVEGGFLLQDRSGVAQPLRYGDFLILPYEKKSCEAYLQALTQAGIPVSFAGTQYLGEVPQVHRLVQLLTYLRDTDDGAALPGALKAWYGLGDLAQMWSLRAAYGRDLTLYVKSAKRLQEIRETDTEHTALLAALGDLQEKRRLSRTMPPKAALERFAQETAASCMDARQAANLRQFLLMAGACPYADWYRFCGYAISCAQQEVTRDLELTPSEDCVRVMNVHKSKGLEGKVVILPLDVGKPGKPQKADKEENGVVKRYYQIKGYQGGWGVPVYQSSSLTKEMIEDAQEQNQEERLRLLYVAATRAEQMLCINCNSARWEEDAKAELSSRWQELIPTDDKDIRFQPQGLFDVLTASPMPARGAAAAAVSQVVDPAANLQEALERCAAPLSRHISPSTIEADNGHYRKEPLSAQEREEAPASAPEQGIVPRGAHWGTMVHRLLELYVSRGTEQRPAMALQAVQEVLIEVEAGEWPQLFGDAIPETQKEREQLLVERALEATAFYLDEHSPLRALLAGGKAYPELPFVLHLSPQDGDALYAYAREKTTCPSGMPITVSGILDLAILRDGEWDIVDYKTNVPRPGETQEAAKERWVHHYRSQLQMYAAVLWKLTGRPVRSIQLCAIALGGELLPIEE